ncbi:MAG: hypothetical protein E5V85_23610 [Mesorhizobium sp.]|nr:MAG: hypothetical protein E5V85_23610 [Mesorhizobium sp.]
MRDAKRRRGAFKRDAKHRRGTIPKRDAEHRRHAFTRDAKHYLSAMRSIVAADSRNLTAQYRASSKRDALRHRRA